VAQLPAAGARVQAQEMLASLRLPSALRQQLLMAGHQLRQAEMAVLRLQRQREQLAGERRAALAKTAPRQRGDAKLKARLRLLERQERQVRAALVAAQNRRAQAQQARAIKAEAARSMQILAPRAAVVDAVSAKVGDQVAPGQAVLSLVDGERLTLGFVLHEPVKLQAPAQVPVLVGHGPHKTLMGTVQPAAPGAPSQLTVSLAGADLPFAQEAYTLVASRNARALHVPKEAVVSPGAGKGAHIWQLVDGRIQRVAVAVLDGDATHVWVAPDGPPVGDSMPVVVQVQGAAWPSLRDGARANPLTHGG
jgi:biotin carboxyl carrier protein